MKIKLIIGSLLILVLGTTIFDWQYGLKLANRIEANIETNPLIKKNFSKVSFSGIKVSPILSKVTFQDFRAENGYSIKCDRLIIKMKHNEARELSQTNSLEKLTKLALFADNLNVLKQKEWYSASKFSLKFNGDIKPNDFPNALKSSQNAELHAEMLTTSGEIFGDLTWNEDLDEIKSINANLSNDANAQMVTLKGLKVVSSLINTDIKAKYYYNNDLKSEKVQFVSDIVSVNKTIGFGNISNIGLYSIDGIVQHAVGELVFDKSGEIDQKNTTCKINMTVQNASLDFNKETRRMYTNQLSIVGVNLDDLRISNLYLNGELRNGDLFLSNTKMQTPLLNAKIKSQIKFDFVKPHESLIKTSEVKVDIIEPNLKGSFEGIERLFGLKIPRSGDELVLEFKGSLKKPLIKGVHYK